MQAEDADAQSKHPSGRRRLRVVSVLLAIAACVYAGTLLLSRIPAVQRAVESAVAGRSGFEIHCGGMHVDYDLALACEGAAVAVPGQPPFLTAARLRVAPSLSSLVRARVGSVRIESPHVFINRLPFVPASQSAAQARLPLITAIALQDAVVVSRLGDRDVEVGPLNTDLELLPSGDALRIRGMSEAGAAGLHIDWTAEMRTTQPALHGELHARVASVAEAVRAITGIAIPSVPNAAATAVATVSGDPAAQLDVQLDATTGGVASGTEIGVHGDGHIDTPSRAAELHAALHPDPAVPPLGVVAAITLPESAAAPLAEIAVEWTDVPLAPLARLWPGVSADGALELRGHLRGPLNALAGDGTVGLRQALVRGDGWDIAGGLELPWRSASEHLEIESGGELHGVRGSFGDWSWTLGHSRVAGDVHLEGGTIRVTSTVSAADLAFRSADGLWVGDQVSVDGSSEVRWPPAGQWNAALDVLTSGELLWDRVYVQLGSPPLRLRGSVRRAADGLHVERATASASGIGSVDLGGVYRPDGSYAVQAQFDLSGLDRLYRIAVGEPWRDQYPLLDRVRLGGHLHGSIEHTQARKARQSTTGTIRLRDGHIVVARAAPAEGSAVDIRGIELDMPLNVGNGPLAEESQAGVLHLGALQLGDIRIADVAVPLEVGPNHVAVTRPVRVSVLGGVLGLLDVAAEQLHTPERRARFSLQVEHIDLGRVAHAFGWPPQVGTIGGTMSAVTVDTTALHSDGELAISAFGGDIHVYHLRIDQLTSPVPALGMDVDFDRIALEPLTKTFALGPISGVARGAVHDLIIAGGQPLRFEAWMETVPTADVPQRISVEALDQVSIIGGAGGIPLSRGIMSFFDEYRYAKMGFRCRLENDEFVLHGVEQHEGNEYLVVGSFLPPRVNVVSHTERIAFSDMMQRLQRLNADRREQARSKLEGHP